MGILFTYLFLVLDHIWHAHGFLLELCSGIILGGLRGPYSMLGIESAKCKANTLPAIPFSPALSYLNFSHKKGKMENEGREELSSLKT